jgi:predicted Fe-S protein YdhL (DUF1289 family)
MAFNFDIPLPSPCLSVCALDAETGYCKGCLRTAEEIASWPALDEPGRRAVLARLKERRAALGLGRRRETRRRRLDSAES